MLKKNIWLQSSLILSLVACGSTKNNSTENNNISPSLSYFQMKVDVSGLNGSLILSNRGGDAVTIQQNGIATLPTSWTKHSQYEIKVIDEPCPQRCVVEHPRGQIGTNGSLTLKVSCTPKTWDYPTSTTDTVSLPYTSAMSPVVSMNQYGDTLLTWFQNDYYNLQLYKAEFENGQITKPASITDHFSFSGEDVADYANTINARNESGVVWTQESPAGRNLYVADAESGQWNFPASSAHVVNVGGLPVTVHNPVIRSNALGEKIALWTQDVGSNTRLYKAEYRNGVWDFPTNLIDNINPDSNDVSWVDAAINDIGQIIVVWQQSNGSNEQIFVSEYQNGIWTHPTGLNDNLSVSGSDAREPRVAMNNIGDVYVVWYQEDNTANSRYQVFIAEKHSGAWELPVSLNDNISPTGKHSRYPAVVTNDSGQAKIASVFRVDDSAGAYQTAIQEKAGNSGWSSPMILTQTNANYSPSRPQLGMDEQGNALVVWSLQTVGDVYKAEFRNGVWLLPDLASTSVNFAAATYDYPSVSVNNCRATIAWQQRNASGVEQIYMAQYR